jgi:hypothetical protein
MPVPLLFFAASVLSADMKVDHITVAARDLKQLQAKFSAAGIHSEFGGKHTNGLTEMAIASFPDGSYLELIAAQTPAGAAAHYWGKFIDSDGGPCAWAMPVADVAASGLAEHPVRTGRLRPDGVSLEWESSGVGPEIQGTFFPFIIHDITPRERRAFPKGKPSAPEFKGVAQVVIGVHNLETAIGRYRQTFHLPAPELSDDRELDVHLATFAGTPVVLASPASPKSPLAARLEKFGDAPYLFVLERANQPSGPGRKIAWNLPLGIGVR